MENNITLFQLEDSLVEKLKKFRFRKETDNAAIIMKIDRQKQIVILEEEYNSISIEEIANELPHSQPRYILYSYALHHSDGRISYPLCFIFVTPEGCAPELQMMYAGSLKNIIAKAGLTKVFEVRDIEDLTEEWLKEKLSFFK